MPVLSMSFLKLMTQLKGYSTTVLFGRVGDVDKNTPKALRSLSSVTIELPGIKISDLAASRNTQHAINQSALQPVMEKSTLHSVK